MTPEICRALKIIACLTACSFHWVPLAIWEQRIGHPIYCGLVGSILYSAAWLVGCLWVLTPTEQQRGARR